MADATATPAAVRCTHCSLPVPPGLRIEGRDEQFCCSACEAVYEAIHGCGLEAYYQIREAARAGAQPAVQAAIGSRSEYDDPAFHERFVTTEPSGVARCDLLLEGVHCVACVWLLERLPQIVPGALEARLDLGRATLRVTWDPQQTPLSALVRAIESLGYPVHPARTGDAQSLRKREDRRALAAIAVAGACTGNVMLLSVALYGGFTEGFDDAYRSWFRWLAAGLAAISLLGPARVFYRGAWAAIRARQGRLDMPIAIALAVAGLAGVINAVRGEGEIYFDSLTMLVFLLLVGRFLQSRQQRRATDAVELLYSLTPTRARVVDENGTRTETSIDAVERGMLVEVKPGESVPVDGTVEEVVDAERVAFDASILTGESAPVETSVGQPVAAGSVCTHSTAVIRATAVGAETRIGNLMRSLERLASERTPVIGAAEKLAGWFVGAVTLLSLITLIAWWHAGPAVAIEHAVALLIACCPCALALATPLATSLAIGRAASLGILIKGGGVLETLQRPGTLLLDKTGTLTRGAFGLASEWGDAESRAYAAALEADSTHPIGRALAEDRPLYRATQVEHRTGKGVVGSIGGIRTATGSASFMQDLGITIPQGFVQQATIAARTGRTPIYVARSENVVGLLELGDSPRPETRAHLDALRAAGWDIRILSGDHPEAVRACGERLGLDLEDCRGGLSPEQKVHAVESAAAQSSGPVVMVGDGVNDAPALARAEVGIAVSGGAEASLAAADVYLRTPGIEGLRLLTEGSRRACTIIRTAIAVSVVYNALAVTLAMAGLLSPLIAAIVMPISSASVLAVAIGGRSFQRKRTRAVAEPAPHISPIGGTA